MLAAQPPCYLIWTFTDSFGKLLFIQVFLTYKRVKSIRYGKREPGFFPLLPRYLIDDLEVSVPYILNSLKCKGGGKWQEWIT